MNLLRKTGLTGVLFFLMLSFASGQTHYVYLSHPVYRVLDYLDASGSISLPHYQKPYTRYHVRQLLQHAYEKEPTDLLRRYLTEFEDKDRHLVSYNSHGSEFLGDIIVGWSTRSDKKSVPYNRFNTGGNIRGHLGSSFSYQTDIVTTVFLGNLNLLDEYRVFEELSPVKHHPDQSIASTDFSESQLIVSAPWGHVSFGSDLLTWGPASSGNLLLDIGPYAMPNIHASAHFGLFHFTKFFGTLDKLYPTPVAGGKEYLASNRTFVAHRLDMHFNERFHAGVSEAILYNRELELSYLNPLIPFAVSEVQAGDSDNNLASIDVSFKPIDNMTAYAELLIDDVDFQQNWFEDYVNKWAILVGTQWANLFSIKPSLLTVEAIRVEPYVFTHRDTANHYEFYGQSIGYDLEPNSLKYFLSYEFFHHHNLWHDMSFSLTYHGDGDRIFGNPEDKRMKKQFLKGVYESRMDLHYNLRYEFFENMWVALGLHYTSIENEKVDNTQSDYSGDRERLGVSVSLSVNY